MKGGCLIGGLAGKLAGSLLVSTEYNNYCQNLLDWPNIGRRKCAETRIENLPQRMFTIPFATLALLFFLWLERN